MNFTNSRYPLTRYERITEVSMDLCMSKLSKCLQMACSSELDPVCGNDGVSYQNACYLRKATCTTGVQQAHRGKCADFTVDDDCPKECPAEVVGETPVCGSDGNGYK